MNTFCPHCGAENAVHHRFCHFCGSALASTGARAVPAPASRVSRWRTFVHANGGAIIAGWTRLAGVAQEQGRRSGGALTALSAAFPAHAETSEGPGGAAGRIRLWEIAALAALTFIALVVRVQQLETVPPGIANDEAEMAVEALRIARGEAWPGAWSGITLGTPSGLLLLEALLFLLLDASIATARLSAALPGVALIPAAYLLMRQLFSARAALLTAAFLSFHVWFIVLSRIAFPAMLSALCFVAAMWLLITGVRSNRAWVAGLGGMLLGLGWYTYKPFPVYAVCAWGLFVLLLLLRKDLRRAECYWFLGASVAASAHLILFYLTSDVIQSSFRTYDQTSLSPLPLFSRAWEVITYVHTPVPHEGITGTGGIPILHFSGEVFFWIGLGVLLLFIRRRSSHLLLAGWLIALVPAVLTPDAESRRYLLGGFFVLAIAAIGLDTVLSLLHNRWKRYARALPIPILAGWFGNAVAGVALGLFVLFFAAQQDQDFEDWLVASEWALVRNEVAAARFARSLGDGYEIRLYSGRLSSANSVVRWLLPETEVKNGSTAFGGSGGIDADSVSGPTVWLLSENYLPLIPELETVFPQGSLTFENNERGELQYAAYVLNVS